MSGDLPLLKLKPIHDHSLSAFDEGLTSGNFGEMEANALNLVEQYPLKTSMELLQIGVELEIYKDMNPNHIRPRLDALIRRYGRVIRPSRRKCEVTGKTAYTHCLNPDFNKFNAHQVSNGHIIKYHIEERSKSNPDKNHTTIYYHDGRITCSCPGFRFADRCHHVAGLRLAIDGSISSNDRAYIAKKIGLKGVPG